MVVIFEDVQRSARRLVWTGEERNPPITWLRP